MNYTKTPLPNIKQIDLINQQRRKREIHSETVSHSLEKAH